MRTLILCSCATILALLSSCAVSVAPLDGGCYPPMLRVPVYAGGFCPPPAPAYYGRSFGCYQPPVFYRRPVITYGYRGGFCPPVRYSTCPPPPRWHCR